MQKLPGQFLFLQELPWRIPVAWLEVCSTRSAPGLPLKLRSQHAWAQMPTVHLTESILLSFPLGWEGVWEWVKVIPQILSLSFFSFSPLKRVAVKQVVKNYNKSQLGTKGYLPNKEDLGSEVNPLRHTQRYIQSSRAGISNMLSRGNAIFF